MYLFLMFRGTEALKEFTRSIQNDWETKGILLLLITMTAFFAVFIQAIQTKQIFILQQYQ